jgi:hypothetical protein
LNPPAELGRRPHQVHHVHAGEDVALFERVPDLGQQLDGKRGWGFQRDVDVRGPAGVVARARTEKKDSRRKSSE